MEPTSTEGRIDCVWFFDIYFQIAYPGLGMEFVVRMCLHIVTISSLFIVMYLHRPVPHLFHTFSLLCVVLFGAHPFSLADELPSWQSCVAHLREYTKSIKTLRLTVDVEVVAKDGNSRVIYEQQFQLHVALDFPNKNGSVQIQNFPSLSSKKTNPVISESLLIDNIFYDLKPDPNGDQSLIFCPTLSADNPEANGSFLVPLFKNTDPPIFLGLIATSDGQIVNISDLLDASVNVLDAVDVDKIKILSSSSNSNIEIVLNQSMNYLPIAIFCKNKPSQQPRQLKEFRYAVDEIVTHNEINFPKSYTVEMTSEIQDQVWSDEKKMPVSVQMQVKSEYRVNFSQVSINDTTPTKGFSFTTKVPNYTEVVVEDALQIKYVWLDGKVVPYTDELALARLRGHGFVPGVREPRFWMMAAGIIMIVVALVAKAREYIPKRKGG